MILKNLAVQGGECQMNSRLLKSALEADIQTKTKIQSCNVSSNRRRHAEFFKTLNNKNRKSESNLTIVSNSLHRLLVANFYSNSSSNISQR